MRGAGRLVIVLGLVSLLTDLSTEMIYPLLPVFLAGTLRAGPAALGAIEGFAELVSAWLKIVSGRLSDRSGRRKPLVALGYGVSGFVRPLVAFAGSWLVVLAVRVTDRVGKGLRTSPRDALLAESVPRARIGAAFGVQRGMDHAGAIIGPLVASALLAAGLGMRSVFLLAGVPAALAFLLIVFGVREPKQAPARAPRAPTLQGWRALGRDYWRFLLAIFVFTLGSSADAFLLLRLSDVGLESAQIALAWSGLHVVKMVSSALFGAIGDRVGQRRLVLAGWALYAGVYAAFATIRTTEATVVVFLVYGLFFGLTEPTERAWIATLAPAALRGTAYGVYHAAVGLAALPASLVFGVIWSVWGAPPAFFLGAGLAGVGTLLLLRVPDTAHRTPAAEHPEPPKPVAGD